MVVRVRSEACLSSLLSLLTVLARGGEPLDLDLPYTPETVVKEADGEALAAFPYYGETYEGSAVVFVLDLSGSVRGCRLESLKDETQRAIAALPAEAEFNVLGFHDGVEALSSSGLVKATEANRARARAWVDGLKVPPQANSNLWGAVKQAFGDLAKSRRHCRTVIIVHDGEPQTVELFGPPALESALSLIALLNRGKAVTVHTIYVERSPDDRGKDGNQLSFAEREAFLKEVAGQNRGTYRYVPCSR